ncbi:ROK family protein [Geobacter pickeringii]|uniref:ROK family transcriptional regulator n=1 Tax=Geobacter pickeringii TaxID=345632 RepID=A0A0B5B9C0_9BACT|nr:ROK family protein [Geobacter pickeringii]AJE03318.1 ROK family transcriptional regulator [Geobacter pickeringii]
MRDDDRELFAGIDVGGTNLRLALVDRAGEIRHRIRLKTEIAGGRDLLYERIREGINGLRGRAAELGATISALGVGVPGLIANDGYVHVSVNLPPIDRVNLRDDLQRITALPTVIANDVNAFAWGERRYGAGAHFSSFMMVTLGTGVGGGLVLNGRLWTGVDGVAGELGHLTVEPNGRPCTCGNRGCLEQYASATAIATSAREAMTGETGWAPGVVRSEGISAEAVAAAARGGDPRAAAVFADAGRYLGIAAAGLANILNLEAFIVGGGVAASFDLMKDAMKQEVRTRAFPLPGERLQIIPAILGENGGLIGSAALAMQVRDNGTWD